MFDRLRWRPLAFEPLQDCRKVTKVISYKFSASCFFGQNFFETNTASGMLRFSRHPEWVCYAARTARCNTLILHKLLSGESEMNEVPCFVDWQKLVCSQNRQIQTTSLIGAFVKGAFDLKALDECFELEVASTAVGVLAFTHGPARTSESKV